MDIYLDLDKDMCTGEFQISIGDGNTGYRIAGPKYIGSSRRLERHKITRHDAQQIRKFLDEAFPADSGAYSGDME